MNDQAEITRRVLRIVLQPGTIWYDVVVEKDFDLFSFLSESETIDRVVFSNNDIQLYAPLNDVKTMFVFKATMQVKFNVVNFPGQSCEPPKAS